MDGVQIMEEITHILAGDYLDRSEIVRDDELTSRTYRILANNLRPNESIYTDQATMNEAEKFIKENYPGVEYDRGELRPALDGVAISQGNYDKLVWILSKKPELRESYTDEVMAAQRAAIGNIYYYIDNIVRGILFLQDLVQLPLLTHHNLFLNVIYVTTHERRHLVQSADQFTNLDYLLTGDQPIDPNKDPVKYMNQPHELDANFAALSKLRQYI